MIVQLDTENADRNLTSQVTVLTDTPDASNPMICQGLIYFGDGSKNLDGSGGDFELTITVGGQTIEPDPQKITFSTAVRTAVWTTPFPVVANAEVIMKAKSPNAADSDVDVTAYLYDISAQGALVLNNLDHLCKTATGSADMTNEVADNTVISRTLANGDTSAFVPSTDGLQLIRDHQTTVKTDTAAILLDTGTNGVVIADGYLTAAKFANYFITASSIAADAINASKVAAATIDNATFAADVGSEPYATNILALAARKALDAIGLDHLVAVADNDDVVDNAIIAKLASKAATANWSDFVNTTDSLQAIRDKQTDIEADTADIQTQVGTAGAGLTDLGGMSTGMKAEVEAESNDALVDLNLDHLMKAPVSNRDTMPEVVDDTVLANIMTKTDGDTSDFDHATDSLEAISDRISSVMTDFLNVTYLIPPSIDLADTATVRLGINLTNSIDDLPSTAEITPGTITIDHKAVGGTSWTNLVNAAACSEIAGLVYYDEVFDSTTGYADGDSLRITFKSVKITVGGNDLEVIGSTGRIFYTSIREVHKIAGGYACTITLKNAGGTAVIEGASFWLSTSSSGTPVVGTAQRTDTNGQAVWWLKNGTYYGFATAGVGYTYSNDDSFTVASAAASKTFNYGTQVSGTSSLGSGITGGLDSFLVRCVDEIRMLTDEPETNAKYSDTRLIQMIESAYAEILQDAQRNATTAIMATYTFDYDADILFYDLPETCGTVLGVYVENANESRYFFGRGSELSGYGPGVTIQNNQLRFQPGIAADGEEITVNYLPNGCAKLFSATTSTYDNDADPNTITASVVDTGYQDPRANVYRGYLLRVLTAAYAQTRVISSHTTAGVFSVRTEFDPELVGEVIFEICPELPLNLDMVVASKVAMTILGNEGNTRRFQTVKTVYTDRQRTIMLALTNRDYDYGSKIKDDGRHQRGGSKRRRMRM